MLYLQKKKAMTQAKQSPEYLIFEDISTQHFDIFTTLSFIVLFHAVYNTITLIASNLALM